MAENKMRKCMASSMSLINHKSNVMEILLKISIPGA
jgi:hypothetical protein